MTIRIDKAVTIRPAVWNEIITAVIAPGPASSGNANGTTPDSPCVPAPANLHSPCVRSSIDTMKSRMPPATMKLEMVILKMDSICVPATANTKSKPAAVMIAVFVTDALSVLSIFCVSAINTGTLPTGSITTKSAIVDLIRSVRKVEET